ncbi:MAG TPA: FkbM family methyltransferase [Vicinamibacteria bacterium]|jgi:FkbM family methyltransferase
MKTPARLAVLLLLVGCATHPRSSPRPSFDVDKILSRDLLRQANHGREVVGADGHFVIPRGARRAWIDVGAHMLETTKTELTTHDDLVLIAIEPLAECWKLWPDNPRLIAVPVAISLERGWMDFNVNAANVTSSLLKSVAGNSVDVATRTVEVRKVPVIRLDDVLERIGPDIDVEYVKTDVQGVDLQVLQSAGESLRRAKGVRAEVINEAIYQASGQLHPGTEKEFVDYMASKGFEFVRDDEIWQRRAWLDKVFVNRQRMGWFWRARRRMAATFS